MGGYAWVTLATNDPYCLGALVLAHSLKRVETKHDLVILITPGITCTMREKLNAVFSLVEEVNVLNSQDEANLALLARPELGITFTKLHCWKLTQYEKCVFVDADALVIRNCDELFEREELSAAPDVGWPDCFNSGVFVFKPSQTTFESLTSFAASKGSFDGGDQGLLNQYFNDWAHKDITKHLPFIYNMCSTATYSYLPAYKQFGKDVKIIHFIGSTKPWLQYFDSQTRQVHPSSESGHLETLLQHWWNIFCEMVHPQLSPQMLSQDDQDSNINEARSTLAPIWHDSYPRVSTIASKLSNNIFNNSTDVTYDKVDVPIPDFSEFRDPWEHYNDEANECNDNHNSNEYIHNTNNLKNGETQYQSNDNTSYRPQYMNNQSSGQNNNYDYCDDSKSYKIDVHVEHLDNTHIDLTKIGNNKLTELHDGVNYLDEYSNPQYCSNHDRSSNEKTENDQHGYNTNQHYRYDSSLNDTQYIQSQSAHEYIRKGEKLKDEDSHDCQNNIVCTDTPTISSHHHSQTCTESKSITCQSKTNTFDDVAHNNTGIAGALAKMTLGTARTPEQEAFEQHMRKQSWEQGKIDYMGRDSFDNIWTKICTTITTVNERESTIPYEKVDQSITAAQSANMKTQAPTTEAEVPTLQHPHEAIKYVRPHENIKEETIALNAACCENPTFPPEMSDRYIPPELMSATNAITQNSDGIMQECPKSFSTSKCSSLEFCSHESSGQYENMRTVVVDAAPQAKGDKCIRIPTVIPLPFSPEIELGSMMSTANQMNETRLKESFAIRELQTTRDDVISSVPMQVAESVLEADIKESVSEDVRPVTEEAISSISAPIRESISAVMETPLEPRAPAHSQSAVALLPLKANGTAVSTEFSQSSELIVPLISSAVSQQELLIKTAPTCVPTTSSSSSSSSSSDSVLKGVRKSGTQMKESERIVSTIGTTSEDESPSYDQQNVSQTTPYEASSTQDITHIFQISEPTTVIAPTAETTIIPNVQSKTNVLDNVSLEAEPLMAKYDENQHEKPLVIIKSGIPGTPIITEATPPTSPLLDATASSEQINKITEKIVNKAIPKSSAEGKIERNETEESKKLTKRINKKASSCLSKKSKEPREMLEDSTCSSAVGKPKKIIKVKKITKSVHSLETTTCVPDTPPPTTSDTPIPPKRKVKSVISKPPTNKPDAEL